MLRPKGSELPKKAEKIERYIHRKTKSMKKHEEELESCKKRFGWISSLPFRMANLTSTCAFQGVNSASLTVFGATSRGETKRERKSRKGRVGREKRNIVQQSKGSV